MCVYVQKIKDNMEIETVLLTVISYCHVVLRGDLPTYNHKWKLLSIFCPVVIVLGERFKFTL